MLIGLLVVVALGIVLLEGRKGPPSAALLSGRWESKDSLSVQACWGGAVVLAYAPLLKIAAPFSGLSPLIPGDAQTHAVVALNWANQGLLNGWIDSYNGGFPPGIYYPSVGWLLIASIVKLGAPVAMTTQWVGIGFLIASGLGLYASFCYLGARSWVAFAGTLCLVWVSPRNSFVGGFEVYLTTGLLSQTIVMPFAIGMISEVIRGRSVVRLSLFSALSAACHPQVTIAFLCCCSIGLLAAWDRSSSFRFLRASVVAGIASLGIFAPGLASLQIPFGWPPTLTWHITGFGPDRLRWWFLWGDLLDRDRNMVLTTLWAMACVACLFLLRRKTARGLLVGTISAIALSVSGAQIGSLGKLGAILLTFLQPLRLLSVFPILMAASLVVAIEESAPHLRHAFNLLVRSERVRALSLTCLPYLFVVSLVAFLYESRWEWVVGIRSGYERYNGGEFCSLDGFRDGRVGAWARGLKGGRLWMEDDPERSALAMCTVASRIELDSAVPVAQTRGAGAHVGVLLAAFGALHPELPGAARRAESLGIQHVLFSGAPPENADGLWRVSSIVEKVGIAERIGGTDRIGLGCIGEQWMGTDAELRRHVFGCLERSECRGGLLDPNALVSLVPRGLSFSATQQLLDGCDYSSASISEMLRDSSSYRFRVSSPSPVDVVIRASAFSGWRMTIDGKRSDYGVVAPGFMAFRVPTGDHWVEARVGWPRYYWLGVFLAVLGIVAVAKAEVVLRRFGMLRTARAKTLCS